MFKSIYGYLSYLIDIMSFQSFFADTLVGSSSTSGTSIPAVSTQGTTNPVIPNTPATSDVSALPNVVPPGGNELDAQSYNPQALISNQPTGLTASTSSDNMNANLFGKPLTTPSINLPPIEVSAHSAPLVPSTHISATSQVPSTVPYDMRELSAYEYTIARKFRSNNCCITERINLIKYIRFLFQAPTKIEEFNALMSYSMEPAVKQIANEFLALCFARKVDIESFAVHDLRRGIIGYITGTYKGIENKEIFLNLVANVSKQSSMQVLYDNYTRWAVKQKYDKTLFGFIAMLTGAHINDIIRSVIAENKLGLISTMPVSANAAYSKNTPPIFTIHYAMNYDIRNNKNEVGAVIGDCVNYDFINANTKNNSLFHLIIFATSTSYRITAVWFDKEDIPLLLQTREALMKNGQ